MRRRAAALLLALLAAPAARAQAPDVAGAAASACARPGANPRERLDCLTRAQDEAQGRLDRAFAGVLAAIRANEAAQPPQRTRWANLMEEAQGRFVLWRNFECQSIAPYEGEGGVKSVGGRIGGTGALEQRLVCLIELNATRAAALERRYAPPPGWTYTPPAPPPVEAAPSGPVVAPPASRIIQMP